MKILIYCLMFSILLWLIPFSIRFFLVDPQNYQNSNSYSTPLLKKESIVEQISQEVQKGERKYVFLLILKNNIKGCLLNIAGGTLCALGTIMNLAINGFYSADVLVASYRAGNTISSILSVTLPHSFELVGFWLSGAIGLYIAWNFVLFLRHVSFPTIYFCKIIFLSTTIVFFIILLAAYVEAYISIN